MKTRTKPTNRIAEMDPTPPDRAALLAWWAQAFAMVQDITDEANRIARRMVHEEDSERWDRLGGYLTDLTATFADCIPHSPNPIPSPLD